MNTSGITLRVLVAATAITAANAQSACGACNCQFNNIQLLDQLLEAKMKSTLASEPRKLHYITMLLSIMLSFLQFCNY